MLKTNSSKIESTHGYRAAENFRLCVVSSFAFIIWLVLGEALVFGFYYLTTHCATKSVIHTIHGLEACCGIVWVGLMIILSILNIWYWYGMCYEFFKSIGTIEFNSRK